MVHTLLPLALYALGHLGMYIYIYIYVHNVVTSQLHNLCALMQIQLAVMHIIISQQQQLSKYPYVGIFKFGKLAWGSRGGVIPGFGTKI